MQPLYLPLSIIGKLLNKNLSPFKGITFFLIFIHKNIEYKYILPSKYIDVKYSYGRDQDKDDINFYNKYLKNN